MDLPHERQWAPRIWEGMDFFAWLRLLAAGRGRVGFWQWYIAGIITANSFINTLFRWLQHARHGRAIDAIQLEDPIFILGHWRTGTSLLHELLLEDDRFTGPTSLQCFEPCHCVLSETLFRKHLAFLLPAKRPMDNMAAGWDVPQEDEFAMALLGQASTYSQIAWPNQPTTSEALTLDHLTPRQLRDWKRTFLRFLKTVTYMDNRNRPGQPQRRLVLKSPPHTARIPILLDMFPDAKFIYLKRDPYIVYLSTMNLWQSFAKKHGMQTPRRDDLIEEKVLREYKTMIDRYESTKKLIPENRLVELRYEYLTSNFEDNLEYVYTRLELGHWEQTRPKVIANVQRRKSYSPNRYEISDAVREIVRRHWNTNTQ